MHAIASFIFAGLCGIASVSDSPELSEYREMTTMFFAEATNLAYLERCGLIRFGSAILSAEQPNLIQSFVMKNGHLPNGFSNFSADLKKATESGIELADADLASGACRLRAQDERELSVIRSRISAITGVPESMIRRR